MTPRKLVGRKRKLTDEQVRQIVEWKRLSTLAREFGVGLKFAQQLRGGYRYKNPSP